MASVVIAGDTSGTVTLAAPAVAGTTTLTLPTANGTILTNASTGISASNITTGTLPKAQLPTGSVLQVVQSSSTNQTTTTSSNFQATGHSVTITPLFASSKILLLHQGMINVLGSTAWSWAAIFRNASVNLYSGGAYDSAGGIYINGGVDNHCPITFSVLDSPNTTSATTYTVYLKNNNNSTGVRYNADAWKLYFIAMEIAG